MKGTLEGRVITGWPAYRVARLGVGLVPEGRRLFPQMSVIENLRLGDETELYLGLIHHDDATGDAARLAAARRHARVDGVGTECGMARGDPARLPALLAAHAHAAELA